MNSLPDGANNSVMLALRGGFDLNVSQEVSPGTSDKMILETLNFINYEFTYHFFRHIKRMLPGSLSMMMKSSATRRNQVLYSADVFFPVK